MNYRVAHPFLHVLTVAAVALVVVGLAGCHGRDVGSLDQITVVKMRYAIDESEDVVRVVGLAHNTGELPTPDAEIIATLRSRTGSFKGQNRIELPALPAGAGQKFALAIDSHGSVESVEMAIVEPGTVVAEGGEDTAVNAAGDAPSNSTEEGDEDGS